MARLIPSITLSQITNPGEYTIAKLLQQKLPESVEIYHSINWVSKPKNRSHLLEGECDFTLVDPQNGILFIEVKGGSVSFDHDSKNWIRKTGSGRIDVLPKDPYQQAQTNMYRLMQVIKSRFGVSKLNFAYGFAVAYPHSISVGMLPPNINPKQVLDSQSLEQCKQSIDKIFKLFQRPGFQPISKQDQQIIRNALFGEYDTIPVLYRTIEYQEKKMHRCTEDQKKILTLLQNQKTAAIEGGAGTGKTLIALAKAQSCAQAGKRTVFLCFNRALKDWIKGSSTHEFGDLLSIENYHSLARKFIEMGSQSVVDFGGFSRDEWQNRVPDLLFEVSEQIPESKKFDAVIIDEGQDFHEDWLASLEVVFREPLDKKIFYIFYDPNQNLYVGSGWNLPKEFKAPYPLKLNCRNTAEIANYCGSLINENVTTNVKSYYPHELEMEQVKTVRAGFRLVEKYIQKFCISKENQLKPSQIVVLAPRYSKNFGSVEGCWPKKFKSVNATTKLLDWQKNEAVLITTVDSFKGLEADAVIIVTPQLPKFQSHQHVRNYVGCSRAKYILRRIEVLEL